MPDYEIITTDSELSALFTEIDKCPKGDPLSAPIADIETRPGHPQCEANDRFTCRLAGVGFSWGDDKAAYVPLDHDDGNVLRFNRMVRSNEAAFLDMFRAIAESCTWANHLWRFDWGVLRQPRFNVNVNYKWCSYLEAYLTGKYVDAFKGQSGMSDAGLKSLALRVFGYPMKSLAEIGAVGTDGRIDAGLVPAETAAYYTCDDANYSGKVHRYMWPQVNKMFLTQVELRLARWVEQMETNGIPFNAAYCQEQMDKLLEFRPKSKELLLQQIERQLGFRPEINLDSPTKVATLFYSTPAEGGLGYPITVKSKKTKRPSVGAKALANLAKAFDIPYNYIQYKKLMKAGDFLDTDMEKGKGLATYIHPVTNLLHSTFHQGGVPTGRFASSNPNSQNWSDEKIYTLKDGPYREELVLNVRNAVEVPEDELLIFHDNKQAELWVALEEAHQDDVLELIRLGWDGHQATASFLFHCAVELVTADQRKSAKTRNFAIIYGETADGMAEKMAVSREDAEQFMIEYFQRFDKVYVHRTNFIVAARQNMVVYTHFGRPVDLEQYFTHPDRGVRQHGERFAYNALCQGTAADIAKIQMLRACEMLAAYFNPVPIIHQGHDALGYRLTPRNFNFDALPQFYHMVKECVEIPVPGYKLPARTDWKCGWRYGCLVDYKGEPYSEIIEKVREKEAKKRAEKTEVVNESKKAESILILPSQPWTREQLVALKALLQQSPGLNTINVALGSNGSTQIIPIEAYPTSLSLRDAAKFQMVGPCNVVAKKAEDVLGDIVKAAMVVH